MARARKAQAERMAARICRRIDELAKISESPDGITRVAFSREHRRAADLLLTYMAEAGMSVRMDEIGNVIGRHEGERDGLPALMVGSHYDTVRDAGRWDGPLGVLTAIECVAEIAASGARLPYALEVIGFADEEGVRFSSTLLGSRAVAGTFDDGALEARDANGISTRAALEAFGLDPSHIRRAARRRQDVLAYLELHIEQGPVLEAEKLPIGVVTAISGASRFRVELSGMAGHAGTVPMALRRDALAGAAECVLAVEALCADAAGVVGTVGQIEAAPGAVNVIPGQVTFTIDIRAAEDELRRETVSDVVDAIDEIAARRRLKARITKTHENGTALCAPWLRAQLGAAIAASGHRVLELPSGAGHDGMAMIDLTDIAMLFVRCKGGISHHPSEHVDAADVAAGAAVLLRALTDFTPRPPEAQGVGGKGAGGKGTGGKTAPGRETRGRETHGQETRGQVAGTSRAAPGTTRSKVTLAKSATPAKSAAAKPAASKMTAPKSAAPKSTAKVRAAKTLAPDPSAGKTAKGASTERASTPKTEAPKDASRASSRKSK